MIGLAMYLSLFTLGAMLAFVILLGMRVETLFKQGKVMHIKLFYVLVTVISGNAFGLTGFILYILFQRYI